MLCPYLLISINELLISIISFNDINKYGLNVKTAAHKEPYVGILDRYMTNDLPKRARRGAAAMCRTIKLTIETILPTWIQS